MPLLDVEYVSADEAAAALGVSPRTIREWANIYDWFGGRVGGKDWVFTKAEVEKMRTHPRPSVGRPRKPIVGEAAV